MILIQKVFESNGRVVLSSALLAAELSDPLLCIHWVSIIRDFTHLDLIHMDFLKTEKTHEPRTGFI